MDTVEILTNARNRVANKWIQGASKDSDGGFCAVGAIHHGNDGCEPLAEGTPCAIFARAIGLRGAFDIVDWNDNPERTQLQVIAAFDKAIAFAEGRREQ